MPLVTRELNNTGSPLYDPAGTLVANETITFTLVNSTGTPVDTFDSITGERVVGVVTAITDINGEFSVNLWPNDRGIKSTRYKCDIQQDYFHSFLGIVPSGVAALPWVDFRLSANAPTPEDIVTQRLNLHVADAVAHGGGGGNASNLELAQDVDTSGGLVYGYFGGLIREGSLVTVVAAGTVTLPVSQTNYLEVDAAGTVSFNNVGFTSNRVPLTLITTDAENITTVVDKRGFLVVDRVISAAEIDVGTDNVKTVTALSLRDSHFISPFHLIIALGAGHAGGNIVLTHVEVKSTSIEVTGTGILSPVVIIVEDTMHTFVASNKTDDSQTVTFKTAAGLGTVIAAGKHRALYADGDCEPITTSGTGSGDVISPPSATIGNFPIYSSADGVLLSNSIYNASSFDLAGTAAIEAASAVSSGINTHLLSYPHGTAAFNIADNNKLAGIATGATVNSSDSVLLNRLNHTGLQAQSTITSLVTDLAGKQALLGFTAENAANRDTSSGFVGKTIEAINLYDSTRTYLSSLNAGEGAVYAYLLPAASGTIALLTDITGTNSGINTGDQVADGSTITGLGTIGDPFVAVTGGSGDVSGPAGAIGNNFAAFDLATGKLIKDSTYNALSFATIGHNHTGIYEPADATILKDTDIGATVAALAHTHTGIYEPADVTILKDVDIGGTVGDVIAPGIPVTNSNFVAFNLTTGRSIKDSGFNSSSFSGVGHNHSGIYEPADASILKSADIGTTVGNMIQAAAQTVTGAKTFTNGALILRNATNTVSSSFTNAAQAPRLWTLPDATGTLALLTDITGTNSGTNTGDQVGDGSTITGDGTVGNPFSAVTGGSGDVTGPISAVDSNFASFDLNSGKIIKDSGLSNTSFATAAHNHTGIYEPADGSILKSVDIGTTVGNMVLANAETVIGAKTFLNTTLRLRNSAGTQDGWFVNVITASRSWTVPDNSGTLALLTDITGTNSGTNTGDQVADGVTITGVGTIGDPFVSVGGGSGDVSGPALAVSNNFAAFDLTTGKLIKDSGFNYSTFATAGHNHTGVYEPVDNTILKDADIGSTVSGIAHNHAGVYEPADGTILKDADIGITVGNVVGPALAVTNNNFVSFNLTTGKLIKDSGFSSSSFSDIAHNHAGIYEPADATILKDIDIGITVADIAHNHAGIYEPADASILKSADIGVSVGNMLLAGNQTVTAAKTYNDTMLRIRNQLNTVTSWFTNSSTISNVWTLPPNSGIIALTSDITGTNSGTNTGDQVADGVTITGTGTGGDPFVSVGGGSGDVVGPASATNNNFASFNLATGKLIKDSGFSSSSFSDIAHNHAGAYEPADGTILKDADIGITVAAALGANENYVTDADITLLGLTSGTNTGDEPTASTTLAGISEAATITETNTGTDVVRHITPASLVGSALQIKVNGIEAGADVTDSINVAAAGAVMTETDPVYSASEAANITAQNIIDIGNLTNINSGDDPATLTNIGALIGTAGAATPNDTDEVATALTGGGLLQKITWTNVKAFLKTYFDTIFVGGNTTNNIGYLNVPQIITSVDRTFILSDSGKHILHPSADTTARTLTVPANSAVAYPIGTVLSVVNQDAAGVLTIAITTDVMRLGDVGTTGSRTLAANGLATMIKVTATEWLITGTGLT